MSYLAVKEVIVGQSHATVTKEFSTESAAESYAEDLFSAYRRDGYAVTNLNLGQLSKAGVDVRIYVI